MERCCDRQLLEGSDRCIFHDPNAWRTHAELMRQEIGEKIENGDLNFQKYHLPEMDFSEITWEFKGLVDFSEAVFHGKARFSHMTFSDSVDFSDAEFSGEAEFNNAEFSGEAEFFDTKFSGGAAFSFAKFSKNAGFVGAEFLGYAWFSYIEFSGVTDFNRAKFSKTAMFNYTDFLEDASFEHVKFLGVTHFENAKFSEEREIRFDFSRFYEILRFDGIGISNVHFTFKNTILERGLSTNEYLWSLSGFRLRIEESDLASAADSYQALERGFENMGHFRVAGELFYREMTCRKNMIRPWTITYSDLIGLPKRFTNLIQIPMKSSLLRFILNKIELLLRLRVRWSSLINWLWTRLFDISCGFGERPKRVFLGCIFIVLAFTGLYFPIVGTSTNVLERLKTAFLLSLDAFTPGKFLNIPFTSPGEWLVQIETVLGWFILSLFLLVFTRKMSRG